MKILEAISQVDALKSNTYMQSDKVEWLSRLDAMVKKFVIDTHEADGETIFDGYDENTDLNTEMLVSAPFDEIYLRWLEAQIDYYNGEYSHYNNSISLFNNVFNQYKAAYTRSHMPISAGSRFLF